MSYPGNPSLPAAVKDRVLSTFQQTISLYKQGRTDEVAAGCNLLLQMDPMFDPAKKLLEKMRNPSLPIDVDKLVTTATKPQRPPMELAREAMAARDFQTVVQLTTEVLTDDLLNDEARILGDEAREKLEATPFVDQFTRKAEQSISSGNLAAAKMELEKARALDPTHPEVVRIGQAIAARDAAPRPSTGPQPSFVVDAPKPVAQSGRAASPASDFGFTFEEEKPAEVAFSDFSFDAPATADFSFQAPTPKAAPPSSFSFEGPSSGGAEFDFATASVVTSDDDQKKIEQYIADGDRAFAGGDYSQAIDLWSRIFLIDVTNDQASERIESAKARRREIEQKIEPLLVAGIEAFERGDTAKARDNLTEVLRLEPRHATAQEYFDRLGETAAPRAYVPPSPAAPADDDFSFFEDELAMGTESPLVPPDPGSSDAAPPVASKSGKQKAAQAPAKARTARGIPKGLLIGVVAVLLLVAGGWFAWSKMSGGADQEISGVEGQSIINRATVMAANGKIDQAIALLQDIKPGDPAHEKALLMIADLRQKKSSSAQLVDGIPAAQYFDTRLAAAQQAFSVGDYIAAKAAYEQAMRVKPLPPEHKAQYDTATAQASQLDAARTLFRERKYQEAVSNLKPLLAQDPNNLSVRRMIADAHFNLAAQALQEDRLPDAIRELDEVLALTPDDELARRSRELAVRYNGETKDLLYKIYVRYLPLRQAN
jgi:tetratricopeptide (TPR) repeat protein